MDRYTNAGVLVRSAIIQSGKAHLCDGDDYTKDELADAIDQLSRYEDTGLTPDGVAALRDENDRLCAALKLAQTRAADMETELKHLVDANRTMETEVERLRAELERLTAELAAMTARAEALEADLNVLRKKSGWKCYACYYDSHYSRDVCAGCGYNNDNNWRWRGPDGGGEDKL